MDRNPQGPQGRREDCRLLVEAALSAVWTDEQGTLLVTDYGDEDATHFVFVYGAAEWLLEGDDLFVGMNQPFAFVSKTTGAVSFLPMLANFERIDAMTPFGDWPSE